MINQFNSMRSLRGSLLLEIGASPHGYSLERALKLGVALYIGIGLDVTSPGYVRSDWDNVGLLLNMDATSLQFPAEMFDAVFSISTFEHILDVETALSEIARVLKPGGRALVSFEPIWSCSYGHHLHHFGDCAKCIPPWAHLVWGPDQMRQALVEEWPANAPLSLDEAINWIYYDNSINRLDLRQFIKILNEGPLEIEWIVKMKDEEIKQDLILKASEATRLSIEELKIKGLTVLCTKNR
jgi:ubiquinone/menaquinone biosynthesis C-methylase UbiE